MMASLLFVMVVGKEHGYIVAVVVATGTIELEKSGQTWPFGTSQVFGNIFPWPPQKLCIWKNVINELSFLLVTHTTCFDIWFGPYGILKSDLSAGQILDRQGLQVLGQVFGPQDGWSLLGSEYKIWR
jgi:hypothetical protein